MLMIKKGTIWLVLLLGLFLAFSVKAQTPTNDLILSLNPNYPRANEEVSATVSSFSVDLEKTMISWLLDGKLSTQGVGQKSFNFKAGESGKTTSLEVNIETLDGTSITQKTNVVPADFDLIWEAQNSYTPPFYKGKALGTEEGSFKVVAIPSSSEMTGLLYNWSLDGNSKIDSSGYGKSFYSFQKSFLDNQSEVEVNVSSLAGGIAGTQKITVPINKPKLLFYKKDPLFGTRWETSFSDKIFINSNGETIVLEPYFFSPKDLTSNTLETRWSLGDSEISQPKIKNQISIRPQAGESGSSKIKVVLKNLKTLFLNTEKEINVSF